MKGRLLMEFVDLSECRKRVEALIERVARFLLLSIEKGEVPSLSSISRLVEEYVGGGFTCLKVTVKPSIYLAFLERELEKINSMLLDKAMEALSKHMETMKSDLHNLLSMIMTNYAIHEARIVSTFQEMIKRYGKLAVKGDELAASLLKTMEEAVYAAVVRFLAISALLSHLPTSKVEHLTGKIVEAIEWFMREEDNTIILASYHIRNILG